MAKSKEIKFGQPEKPEEKSLTGYREAPESIITLAEDLIAERHFRLRDAQILYLLSEDEIKYQDRLVPGRLYKISEREKTKLKKDFILVIAEPTWEVLSTEDKKAAMDHILCYGTTNSDGGYKLRKPDFLGFYNNISEYGFWNRELKELKKRMGQMSLFKKNTYANDKEEMKDEDIKRPELETVGG